MTLANVSTSTALNLTIGKYNADVTAIITPLPRNRVDLKLLFEEGDAAEIEQINIVGNEIFSDEELMEAFELQYDTPWWDFLSETRYHVIAMIPLGGYVRMLDGRIDDVPPELEDKAFNNKPVLQRMAVIAAGPGVNFIFAFFALWLMYLVGLETVKPVVKQVEPESIAAIAGVQPGDEIIKVGDRNTPDWEAVNLEIVSNIGAEKANVTVKNSSNVEKELTFTLGSWNFDPDSESPLSSLGLTPYRPDATLTVGFVGEPQVTP